MNKITQIIFSLYQTLHKNPSFLFSRLKYYTISGIESGSGSEVEGEQRTRRGEKKKGEEKGKGIFISKKYLEKKNKQKLTLTKKRWKGAWKCSKMDKKWIKKFQ